MADRDDEERRRPAGGWVTSCGQVRSDCLFWSSPRIRSFVLVQPSVRPPVRPQPFDPVDLLPPDADRRPPRGDASR